MISYNEQEKIFYLNSKKSTYAFGVFKDTALVHLYWGKLLLNQLSMSVISSEFKSRSLSAMDFDDISSTILPLEFSTYGSTDMRYPAFNCIHNDGSRISRFKYKSYEITDGKPRLEGLPATYAESGDNVQTLTVRLCDEVENIDVYLSYTVFEDLDAVTRSVKIVNNGDDIRLTSALSMSVDFFGLPESDIIHLDGSWAREREAVRNPIVFGNQNVESRCGASSAFHNPFIAVCDRSTTETSGNAYGLSLVYSGNFTAGVEMNVYNTARAYIGVNPFNFEYALKSGDTFQTPEAVLAYSPDGLSGMSRIYHKLYRTRLCRGKYRDIERFALINNWEATYFDFNEDKIVAIAEKAKEIGVDTMVLDDGWFGTRTDDKKGLGDWVENPDRLPDGIGSLADKINKLGMHFGLWFEPEMVNPDSRLFEAHPDWVLHTKGRKSYCTRNQLTLDLSRDDVCDYIIGAVSAILEKANIEYVKWDMNRYMSEAGSALLPPEKQGEVMHRYILGLYRVLETLTSRFPNVLFESCASGGGRFDPGMLYYMPQTWTSDNSDAVDRLNIQYGTSFVYPFSSMGAHVSACPNHQVGRTTPFKMRCDVALPGQFGFELDLNKCTESELKTAKTAVEQYRRLGEIFHKGDLYRLASPFESDISALEFVSEDKNTVILCIYSKIACANAADRYIKFGGLEENALYILEGTDKAYGGDLLMNRGYKFVNSNEHQTEILVFNKNK